MILCDGEFATVGGRGFIVFTIIFSESECNRSVFICKTSIHIFLYGMI